MIRLLIRLWLLLLTALVLSWPSYAQELKRSAGRATVNGVEIAYQNFGPQRGEAILFIGGVGEAMPAEPDPLVRGLVEDGFRVFQFDHRDSGASTRLEEAGMPDFAQIQQALAKGETPMLPYTLNDMASDTIGLLDVLDIQRAHLVGGSLGGMIAQIVASQHPDRTASLTLISSTTGNPALSQGEPPVGGETMDAATARQAAAASVVGDLRSQSSRIEAPTVVVHGDQDSLFPLAHGRDLATTIPGAHLVTIPGMDHVPEDSHYPEILQAIRHAVREAHAEG